MAEGALLGSAVSTIGGLLAVCIAKTKCEEDGCEPSCAFMDAVLEKDHEEIEVHTVRINDVELLYVNKKEG